MRLPLVMSIIALLLGILIDIYIYRSIPKQKELCRAAYTA